MTKEDAKKIATENFKSGMNCAQSVVATFAEEFGYSSEELTTIVQPFGGGMCRMREVCGTVTGMLFCLGLYNAKQSKKINNPVNDKTQKDETYAVGQKLANAFKEINGSIICKELLGLVPKEKISPISENRTEEYYKKRPCAELCGIAAEIFQNFLDEQECK